MADTIVNFMIDKLTRLLVEEVKLVAGVKDKVTSLQSELKFMNTFLKNSQGKRKEYDIVEEMVTQIRDVTHQAEDVIDTYIVNTINQGRRNVVKRMLVHGVDHAVMLHKLTKKINRIKTTINEILENKDKYGIEGGGGENNIGGQKTERIRKQRTHVEEKEVVGLGRDSKLVIDKLMSKNSHLEVVAIVGMGGLGKTTLARKVFNNKEVQNMFPCRVWGYVSNDYRPREFFLSLLKCLLPPSQYKDLLSDGGGEEKELKLMVQECLNKSSKYLVVVDDVWDIQVWDEIKEAFPDDGRNGSRILITTRLAEVASATGPTLPYSLPFLNKQKSWELLSKKVFRGQECPSNLESTGKEIVESCDGLPLAIIVMAGILANKKSPRDWSRIKQHVNWHLGREKKVEEILKLSYDTLPENLKPCFLYLGMFPEDYKVPTKQLIKLWISEGLLIQENPGSPNTPELEYIAEDYLDKLVDRNLVQVVSRSSDGGVKTCRIHDLFRDLCISESKDDNFFEVCREINVQTFSSRKLSFLGTLFGATLSNDHVSISGTRSLLCFGQEENMVMPDHWKWLIKSFKLARVLDLGQMGVNSIPTDLGKLIHLRYLRIHSHNLKTIPTSIGTLWNLETLDLRGSPIKCFSDELWQLKQLRHLLMLGPVGLPNKTSVSKPMPKLQTLSTVVLDPYTTSLLDSRRFPKLTKLGFHYEKRDMCNPRTQLHCLRHLNHLCKLKLIGTSEIPQVATVFPSTVTKITLTKFGFFNSNVMRTLGKLPNLHVLKLSLQKSDTGCFDLHCATREFPQLQVFEMVGIKIKTWKLDEGSMPCLRRLALRSCKYLVLLPEQLWSLTTLREVNVLLPNKKLAKTLQNLVVKNVVITPHFGYYIDGE